MDEVPGLNPFIALLVGENALDRLLDGVGKRITGPAQFKALRFQPFPNLLIQRGPRWLDWDVSAWVAHLTRSALIEASLLLAHVVSPVAAGCAISHALAREFPSTIRRSRRRMQPR